MGHNGNPDRARHGSGDGHFRARHRARSGTQDCRGQPGRGPARSGRDPRLSWNRRGTQGGRRMIDATTLPRLLRRDAQTMAERPAIREKNLGIWQTSTWSRYYREVRDFASGLAAHGFCRGDLLAVIGDNRPRLYWAQLAAQCLGGVAVPVYQDSIAAELVYVLAHAEVSVIVAEDQEQVDKVLSLENDLPRLRLVIYDDPLGMRQYRHRLLASFEDIAAAGRVHGAAHPGRLEQEIAGGSADDLALLAYTSGTTGKPKGAM